MERDSMLAHGASFLMHDRFLFSSDLHKAYICTDCGSVSAPTPTSSNPAAGPNAASTTPKNAGTNARAGKLSSGGGGQQSSAAAMDEIADDGRPMYCSYCKARDGEQYKASIKHVPMPYVTRYLVSELMAMNIRLFFDVKRMDML
jgi:DNA-directed RNA polymerase I subunit RPA2